jgi:hypothetical protein
MPVSQQLRDRAIADMHIIPWELSESLWGVAIEFDSGSTILEKAGHQGSGRTTGARHSQGCGAGILAACRPHHIEGAVMQQGDH